MTVFKPQPDVTPRVLATDLDGTLIPLPDCPANQEALDTLRRRRDTDPFVLIFATGRHFSSVIEAINAHGLPLPDWIVCDVGTAIYHRQASGFAVFEAFATHLAERTEGVTRDAIERRLAGIDGLIPQAPEHQKPFKISYQSAADVVEALVGAVNRRLGEDPLPYACTGSLDPFLHCGLLDVLPRGVSKAYALDWLSTHADFSPHEVIFAGDSGNDLAALVSGFRAIVVANGSHGLAEKVSAAHQQRNLKNRLYLAAGQATSGVLEGCRHFGLFGP